MQTVLSAEADAPSLRIESCETPAYHLADHIQPHAVFAAVDRATFKVERISANAASTLGMDTDTLLGLDFRVLLTSFAAHALTERAAALKFGRASIVLTFGVSKAFTTDVVLYRSHGLLCLELEATHRPAGPALIATSLPRLLELVANVSEANGPHENLPHITCEALREVTGLDRVYYCLFDHDGHGHVCGESRNDVLPSLFDHHFPASDIPQVARQMFVHNPFRLIPNVDAAPVPILGGNGALLDLTLSSCRAVAASHLAYVRNMGVKASVSFPVVRDGRLAAIFGGHHATAHQPSFRQMEIGRHLVDLFVSRSAYLRVREDSAKLGARTEALFALTTAYRAAGPDLAAFVAANHDAFRGLLDADDLMCLSEGRTHLGRALMQHDAADLLAYLSAALRRTGHTYQTNCLALEEPRFASLCPLVTGVFAISLDIFGGTILAWLRPEIIVIEKWSGDPRADPAAGGGGTVSPRTSFAEWQRQVKGSCQPWQPACTAIARQIRHNFAQVLTSHYEIRMREAAERSNALKSEFVANISHELRSPMHAILGFAELLAGTEELPAATRRVQAGIVLDSGRRLLRLIDNLLDMSKLEAGKMTFALSEGDISPVIEAAISDLRGITGARSIRMTVMDRRRCVRTSFDPLRMAQVIANLLSNAVKFSPAGASVAIVLENAQSGSPGRLRIEVSDQGPGIAEDELEAIFDKFIQGSRTKTSAGGTGLGLAICREIVNAHSGRIWAANNSRGGASFFVEA